MNEKALVERRNECVDQMNAMFQKAEAEENRAFNEEELNAYNGLKKDVEAIDATLKAQEEARAMTPIEAKPAPEAEDQSVVECRAFEAFIRSGKYEQRSDINMVDGSSGVVMPKTISDRILSTIKNISPILAKCDLYMVKGQLVFPKYDESTAAMTVAYASEFSDLEAKSGVFATVTLGNYLAGALTKVSRSLINNVDFDVVSYVIDKMSEAIAKFLEGQLLNGTGSSAMQGVTVGGTAVTAASATAIALADLIKTQMAVNAQYRDSANACWIMNTSTLQAIRLLTDGDNRPLLQPDVSAGFGYSLLGAHVYESDNMAAIATGKAVAVFGDPKGIACRITPEVQVQVLNERYAAQHATGVTAWVEADSKVTIPQALAYLKMA